MTHVATGIPMGTSRTMLAEIPSYVELQDQAAAATAGLDVSRVARARRRHRRDGAPRARRRIRRHRWTAIDANEAMLDRAAQRLPDADLRLSRLEDPLPDGPVRPRRLGARRPPPRRAAQAGPLPPRRGRADTRRRVRPRRRRRPGGSGRRRRSRSTGSYDLPDRVDDQLEWLREAGFDAEPTWSYKDLAVVRASRPQPR